MKSIIEKIGADPRSMAYFEPKREVLKIYVHDADFRAAAFVKQELLARGGDAVAHRNVIDGKTSASDILIMATRGVLTALVQKMHSMDCWGLKELREDLQLFLKNYCQKKINMVTKIMGILNLTPDSFHSASRTGGDDLLVRAEKMLADGADILDIGAESTRPGSASVSLEEEKRRLIEPLKTLREKFPNVIISVDTLKPEIASLAAEVGANIINDVGNDLGMAEVAAKTNLPLVITHSPQATEGVYYSDVVTSVISNLHEKIKIARAKGIEKIIIDPGIGFGKFGADNLRLISSIESLKIFGLPILVGHSRKKFLSLDGLAPEPEDRLPGTLAISALLAGRVEILRVHDVRENVQAVRTVEGLF